ncbi:MAG TPA: XRE family transcriptional regulator [Streptosporangiaceae bacterium]|nr:XRE family transcriptional regulator [Streptosporangiaceae bacterium]
MVGGMGPRLRLAREQRGLSVRELARRIGCSASLVSQIERGVSAPSVGVLYSLATELGSSLDYLVFGSDQPRDLAGPAGPPGPRGSPGPPERCGSGPAITGSVAQRSGTAEHAEADGGADLGPGRHPGGGAAASDTAASDAGAPAPPCIVQRAGCRRIIDLASGVRWERLTPGADAVTDFLEVIYSPGGHSTDERRPLRHDGREYGLVLSGTLQANVGFESYELRAGDSIAFDSATPHEYLNKTGEPVHAVWVVVHAEPGRA